MSKYMIFLLMIAILIFPLQAFSASIHYGDIADMNDGKEGQILVNSGLNDHGTDIGIWTDAEFLKGEKGDQGIAGKDGLNGVDGRDGLNGIDGRDGQDVDPATVTNLQNTDILLQENLNEESVTRYNADNILTDIINSEISDREDADNLLNNGLKKEIRQRKQADKKINKRIDTEINDRTNADTTLQNNINTETIDRINADAQEVENRVAGDNQLQNNIDIVNNDQTDWNKKQDVKIKEFNNIIDNHSNTLNNHEERINRLEETKYLIEANIRVADTKKTTVEIFNSYDVRHNANFATGVRFTWKMGKSYEEKLIEDQNARLARIEKELQLRAVQVKQAEDSNDVQWAGTTVIKTKKF